MLSISLFLIHIKSWSRKNIYKYIRLKNSLMNLKSFILPSRFEIGKSFLKGQLKTSVVLTGTDGKQNK